jgi:hypothetical protein
MILLRCKDNRPFHCFETGDLEGQILVFMHHDLVNF